MREAESSGGTFFDGMSHEQMLAWLDQANAGVVSGAASRLKTAATEILSIAEELKVRPQWVAWKGEGADAFRTWAADLANATLRLSDFSKDSGTWLTHASDAISLAQLSIPRDMPSATANLAAAHAAHNDPDAAGIASKSSAELAALTADREKVRLEAASQMAKLAQSYSWSATQLNALERPKLPPPPEAFVPTAYLVDDATNKARPGDSSRGNSSAQAGHTPSATAEGTSSAGTSSLRHVSGTLAAQPHVPAETPSSVRTSIDSAATLPSQSPVEPPRSPVDPGPAKGTMPQTGSLPPLFGGGQVPSVNNQAVQNRALGTGRLPMTPVGPGTGGATPLGRVPGGAGGNGIVGGRPVLPSEGRTSGVIPRGMVVGGEGTPTRGPMGQTAGSPVGRVTGMQGAIPGGRPAATPGGIVGGRPTANSGAVGSNPSQQAGRRGGRVPASGAVGARQEGTRNAVSGGTTVGAAQNHGAAGPAPRPSQGAPAANTRSGSSRPYGVTEDEETWRRNQRPTVPPVVE